MLFLRQLFDRETCTYTYLVADSESGQAAIIDPVASLVDRDAQLVGELELELRYAIDTHVHADHVTGSRALKERLRAKTVLSKSSGADWDWADIFVQDGDTLSLGRHTLEVRATPGHTGACISIVAPIGHQLAVFSGDAIFVRGTGRTDFQSGDAAILFKSIQTQIYSLPDNTIIYPGHDYKGQLFSTVGEEKLLNPRIKINTPVETFVATMDALKLPNPKLIDVAVPANMAGGPNDCVRNVGPALAQSRLPDFTVVDVRQPGEFTGPLGHIAGARLLPLDRLGQSLQELPRDQPLLLVCASGGRSGRAAKLLADNDFQNVTNLAGGMIAWNAARLPVERS